MTPWRPRIGEGRRLCPAFAAYGLQASYRYGDGRHHPTLTYSPRAAARWRCHDPPPGGISARGQDT